MGRELRKNGTNHGKPIAISSKTGDNFSFYLTKQRFHIAISLA